MLEQKVGYIDDNFMRRRDWLLIIGLCIAPMTGLRIWKIGPAEILCLIWGLKYFPKKYSKINDILKFFTLFLFSMCIGTFIGICIAPNELTLSDWFTWLYLEYLALAFYAGLSTNSYSYNERLFNLFAQLSTLWYLFLYVYSLVLSKSFLGAPLWYGEYRYTGGATNPHQLAILMCGVIFWFVRKVLKRENVLLNMVNIAIALFILVQTASSTGYAAVVLGFLIELYLFFTRLATSEKQKSIILILETLIVLIVLVVSYSYISEKIYAWIASDPNGIGRLEIFSTFSETFQMSPLFGLGPGQHAHWGATGIKEYHNTYLEIFAATGLVGFTSFVVFSIRLLKKLSRDISLIPIMVAMYAYGLAGFAMRRLVFWGLIVFLMVLAEQKKR